MNPAEAIGPRLNPAQEIAELREEINRVKAEREELKAKRNALEAELKGLLATGVSEQKEHDIRQQIIALDNWITSLNNQINNVWGPMLAQQQQAQGQQFHVGDKEEIMKEIAKLKIKHEHSAVVSDSVFINELERSNAIRRVQEVVPTPLQLVTEFGCPDFFQSRTDVPEKKQPTGAAKLCTIHNDDCFTVHQMWKAYSTLVATEKKGHILHYEIQCGYRIPDFTGTASADPPSVYNALFCVELKGSKEAINDGEHLGQALDYLRILLKHQRWRNFCFGCIANQRTMILLKAERTTEKELQYTVYKEVSMEQAEPILAFLLQSGEEQLGAKQFVVHGFPIELHEFLGKGATCSVYSGKWKEQRVAVKLYEKTDAANEINTLEKIKGIEGMPKKHLPAVLAVSEDNKICVVKQYCKLNIDRITPSCVADITSVMELVHKRNIVHCDLRMENLLVDEHCGVVINDWGASVATGELPRGTPPEHQRHPDWRSADPIHDIYSFALSVSLKMLGKKPEADTVLGRAIKATSWDECKKQLEEIFGRTT